MPRTKKKARPELAVDEDLIHALERLYGLVATRLNGAAPRSRTTKLLSAGVPKIAQKVVEEAAEVAIEAVRGEHQKVVRETADLFYNLVVLLAKLDVPLDAVWEEMTRREREYGIAEKLPKDQVTEDAPELSETGV
jgi:phosphoribosyl-ATP pyrophosphohydrolase